jgi:hypothetical protein
MFWRPSSDYAELLPKVADHLRQAVRSLPVHTEPGDDT